MVDAPEWYHFRGSFLMNMIPETSRVMIWGLVVLNVVFPGVGTMIGGCVDSNVMIVSLVVGFLQFSTSWLLIGMVWSWFWAWLMISKSSYPKYERLDESGEDRQENRGETSSIQRPEVADIDDLHDGEVFSATSPGARIDPLDEEYNSILTDIRNSQISESLPDDLIGGSYDPGKDNSIQENQNKNPEDVHGYDPL